MLKNFKPSFFILSIIFFAACSPLEYEENITPASKEALFEDSQIDILTLSSPDEIVARDTRGCNCRVTFNASPNVQQTTWIHDFAFIRDNGATANLSSAGNPNTPLPRSIDLPWDIMRNSPFTHELRFDYDLYPLQEGGTFTFKLACHVAPPYIKTFSLPPVSKVGGGTVTFRGAGRITNECGTIGLEVALD